MKKWQKGKTTELGNGRLLTEFDLVKTHKEAKTEEYFEEPKSWCFCGHLGDGINSQHSGINGHGRCEFNGCDCGQFTWKRFTNRFNEWRARQ